jgi:hypothetical protein
LRLPLPFASLAVAVGHAPRDDEEPLPAVWSSNIGSANARPDRIIPALGKLSENLSEPSSSESCDVLHDDDSRSKFANDSRELPPQTAPRTRETSSAPCCRNVLAGEPAAEDVDGSGGVAPEGSHVLVSHGVGPVSREDSTAPFVTLALPCRFGIKTSLTQGTFESQL